MTTYTYETEARIIMAALKVGLPGKGKGTLTPDMAAIRYAVDGKPAILVTLVNGTIVAQTEGLSAAEGGFLFNGSADEEGARTIAARIVTWVKAH